MKKNTVWSSKYFCGNEVSNYGQEHGYIDYATLAKSFDAVLNNNIISATGWENWEQENGFIDNSEEIEDIESKIEELEEAISTAFDDMLLEVFEIFEKETREKIANLEAEKEELEEQENEYPEIYQYYIISDAGAKILEDYTNEIVYYNSDLDMYVWGVTHWGTSWDYVLTDIKIDLGEQATA